MEIEKTPLSIKAPIILDAKSREGVQPLLELVKGLKTHGNFAAAKAESARMHHYFTAMSKFLKSRIKTLDRRDRHLTKPDTLHRVFNEVAQLTRGTMMSEVIIVPDDIGDGPAKHLFRDLGFSEDYTLFGGRFSFGFLQIHGRSAAHGNITLPVLRIDQRMLQAVQPHDPLPLLQHFQDTMTMVNHDMLHHFTSAMLDDEDTIKTSSPSLKEAFSPWVAKLPSSKGRTARYEDWAQITHERIIVSSQTKTQLKNHIDGYFSHLKRIGDVIQVTDPKPDEVVRFFGLLMAHALIRIFPLNHPLISRCSSRLHEADPSPNKALLEKDLIRGYVEHEQEILDKYRARGLDILPNKRSQISYKNIILAKLLLASPLDIIPHIPDRGSALRKSSTRLTLNMLRIAAQTCKSKGPQSS